MVPDALPVSLSVLYYVQLARGSCLAEAFVDWFRNGPSWIRYDIVVYHAVRSLKARIRKWNLAPSKSNV